MKHADIVVPVFDGLNSVVDCLQSIVRNTSAGSYTLFLIDNHCDRRIREYLDDFSKNRPEVRVVPHLENREYLSACLFGISRGAAPYIVLLNSGAVLPPEWLDRLVGCAERYPDAALVCPLSSDAATHSLPMFPGASFLDMDAYLERHFRSEIAVSPVEIGACTLLRRAMLSECGLPVKKTGDQSDPFRMPMRNSRHQGIVACDTFIYNKACSLETSWNNSRRQYRSLSIGHFLAGCRQLYQAKCSTETIERIRARFAGRRLWDPMPVVWQTARNMLACIREKRLAALPMAGLEGLLRLPFSIRNLPSSSFVHKLTRPHRLRVTYILHNMVIAGGVLSVIQIVNELILLGIEARIVALFKDPGIPEWTRLYTEPIIYKNENEMREHFPPTDIAVATLWTTAPFVNRLVKEGKARIGAYFIQDYEPWFFPESDTVSRQRVLQTYTMIPNRIVKSRWLAGMLAADGYSTHQIPLGMDLGRYYPRDMDISRPVILSMVRPKTPRRGFSSIIAALAEVKKQRPDVEIVLFGDRFLGSYSIPFEFRNEGVVMDQNRLAELYSEATVFLDGSDFQGFGRCGLEAMACGAACVLTGAGGVMEYAVHGENALVVPPKKPDCFASAILELLQNSALRDHLVEGGRCTAQRFCHKREALQTRDYFLSLVRERSETVPEKWI